jgi:Flp pilus assembly protein TadD
VRHRPNDPRGHAGLGEVYEAQQDEELARAAYTRVLALVKGDEAPAAKALAAAANAGLDRLGR